MPNFEHNCTSNVLFSISDRSRYESKDECLYSFPHSLPMRFQFIVQIAVREMHSIIRQLFNNLLSNGISVFDAMLYAILHLMKIIVMFQRSSHSSHI